MGTILLVEDEMVIALGTSMLLEDEGHTVILASDGEAGIAQAIETTPDLIMTDYMMPRMDGLAMIRELRSRGMTVPIVLATSIPEASIEEPPRRLYDAYLSKPYGESALLEVIRHLLANR